MCKNLIMYYLSFNKNRGHESLNLSSLSIPDFIDECMKEISRFRDIRKKLDKNAHMIEDIV
jgi:dynein heavy chain, axonemal